MWATGWEDGTVAKANNEDLVMKTQTASSVLEDFGLNCTSYGEEPEKSVT